jgi:dTDP-4-amino-4,6-dideoxygalactose transaminase
MKIGGQMRVPFFDLKRQYNNITEGIDIAIKKVLDSCGFVAGPQVKKFENDFADYCNIKNAVAVNSGTTAVYLSLKALDIGNHDEVLVPVNTFFATAEAISLTGAEPVFIEIDKRSYNISSQKINEFIENKCIWERKKGILTDVRNKKRIKAIMPVHLYGQMADMKPILDISEKYGLYVIEDAAQAHGAKYKINGEYKKAGTFGDVGAFSFYPSKNLGCYGNGGAVVTDDDEIANKVTIFINHGQYEKYHHDFLGWNFKMNGFQGAILSEKLKYLDKWNKARRKNAEVYNQVLRNAKGIVLPEESENCEHMYHLYVVRVKARKQFQDYLQSNGIGTSIHYPIPLHLQKAYRDLEYKEDDFPIAEKYAKEFVSMPMFPELNREEIEYVGKVVKKFLYT